MFQQIRCELSNKSYLVHSYSDFMIYGVSGKICSVEEHDAFSKYLHLVEVDNSIKIKVHIMQKFSSWKI